jgi:hypothetical protein
MNRSLDTRLGKLEAERGTGRTHCISADGLSTDEIDAEIAQRKGALGEFDQLLLVRWMGADEGAAA